MNQVAVQPKSILVTASASLVLAALALVIFVLPAEYGLDPTGLGKALGISGMSGYEVSALSDERASYREDYVEFPLAPFESIEYKYTLGAGQAMLFSWQAEDEVVFDFHSEETGTDPDDAVTFALGRSKNEHGTYVAPFDGIHGWFWENRGQQEVTVKLKTQGFYTASTTMSRSGEYKREL